MQKPPGLGARLKRLPGQFLLSLINATALLVIAACILVIVVLNQVDSAGERIAGSVTEAALSRLEISPGDFKSRLQEISGRIDRLSEQLQSPGNQEHWELTRQIEELNQNLADLKAAAQGIGAAGPEVTEAAFNQAGATLTDALFALRGCAPAKAIGGAGN